MRKVLLFLQLIVLLTACQSKKEICARWDAEQISYEDAQKALGLDERGWVENYCDYYKD